MPKPTPIATSTLSQPLTPNLRALKTLFGMLVPVPEEWLREAGTAKKSSEMQCVPCTTYAHLQNSWKKALKWTDGLDHALAVMLASIASTKAVGDQLWIKVIGPAACIAGNCFIRYSIQNREGRIINHKGGRLDKLYQRFHNNPSSTSGPAQNNDVTFLVPSVTDDGSIIRNRVVDVIDNGERQTWKITTASGKTVEATDDHEIRKADGSYLALGSLRIGDALSITNGKTQPKGRNKQTKRKEVLVKYHPTAGVKFCNGYKYHRLRSYQVIYEAACNGLTYDEYIQVLNTVDAGEVDLWVIPKDKHMHHKDGNIENNEITNLQLLTNSEHGKHHGPEATKHLAISAESDKIVAIKYVGLKHVYDIVCEDPYRNFSANGIFVHNCGKSTLCEAVTVSQQYVKAVSTLRGFHSGYKANDGEGEGGGDVSLINQLRDKTLVTKDGDTLLQSPNLSQILSEARDLYDSVSRTHYRNSVSRNYEGIRMTWILAGTSSLRSIDSSELGERFLDCVIMEDIDEDLEEEILWRVVNRVDRAMSIEANGKPESQHEPAMAEAMGLTGGYVEWLRVNAAKLLPAITIPEESKRHLTVLGLFVAYMRARPSMHQDEKAERELASRLVSQHTRLAKCLALVMNKETVDDEVMDRVRNVAFDTARGKTLSMVKMLLVEDEGLQTKAVALSTGYSNRDCSILLRFLQQIGAVVQFRPTQVNGSTAGLRWKLSPRLSHILHQLYDVGYE